ncbi:LysR family transcriptional regulator protein (plasmid) [Rhizobium gallicum]|uniref:HTH-type transcriptional regulator TtuA n=1 Tax=Rhizobium gallicum TaxID=56730 RepID=A0A1L5NS02_9HYPH|nr:LysR substrate-binding domain-containing protein [Rhizobium gallicum]APO70685.1 LysR family transcriptional regulator protein [Rhizobium gallicum]
MELRHLRYFVAVAEELHFNRAADRLHMSQPPLSQQIKQLEDELRVPLLNRTKRHVSLTSAGVAFLAEVRKILAHIDYAVTVARDMGSGERGALRFGSIYSAIYSVMPTILRSLSKSYPNLAVDVFELTIAQQLEQLKDGKIDVGILRLPIFDDLVNTRTIFEEGLMAVVPSMHPLARQREVSLDELVDHPLILSGIGLRANFRQQTLDILSRQQKPLIIAREVAEMHTLISLVGSGLGVALVPETVSRIKIADVTYLPLSDEVPKVGVALAWHRERETPALLRLMEVVFSLDLPAQPTD